MKKIVFFAVAFMMLAGVADAQTTTTTQADIEAINSLTEQINELQEQRKAKLSELIIKLGQGSRGEAVTALQTLLALDPAVYPQGLVTGYFGPLTSQAVKKFQAKNGLEQVGFVGPRTVEKLKKWADDNELTVDEDNSGPGNAWGKGKRLCAIVPPGHMIAPGFLKKYGERPNLPSCQTLPPGIKAKIDGNWDDDHGDNDDDDDDDDDNNAPDIDDVDTDDVTAASVKITWETDENSDSRVWYSKNNPVVTTGDANKVDSAMVKEHTVILTGLEEDTTYYFVVGSEDSDDNLAKSSQGSFETDEEDNTDPDIDDLDESNITDSGAKITWTTDEPTTDKIWYSTSSGVSTGGSANMVDNTLGTEHSFTLTGLDDDTEYFYVIEVTDSSGNDTFSSEGSFTTQD
jgi:peptidoglycan hydrolase-like protein with peptidoglycan-binding domain